MHDIDRTQLEWEQYETPGYEVAQESGALYGELPMHETHELELAAELLEVSTEEELEQFLGNVFRTVGGTIGAFARSDTGRAVTQALRDAARQALPTVGGAVGDWVAPGRGGAVGSRLAQQAGTLLGLELEGLSPPDQEFEAARQFVRFAGNAYANAAGAPAGFHPMAAAEQAVAAAAQEFAPGLGEAEEEAGRYRGSRARGYQRPQRSRGYRSRPQRPAFSPYPVYGGYAPYPEPPVDYGSFDEPGWGGDTQPAGPAGEPVEEPYFEHAPGSNGYPAGARNGRWVKRGRVLVIYGA
jgi:hypothetical protein